MTEPHKQVELILPDGRHTVTWLPSPGLVEGKSVNDAVILHLYSTVFNKCTKCHKLLEPAIINHKCDD